MARVHLSRLPPKGAHDDDSRPPVVSCRYCNHPLNQWQSTYSYSGLSLGRRSCSRRSDNARNYRGDSLVRSPRLQGRTLAPTSTRSSVVTRGRSRIGREEKMMRLVTVAFALALMSSAQATPLAPVQQPDSIITPAAAACGPGMTRINGVCVSRHHKRQARRCLRWNGSTCAAWQ